MDGNDTKRAFIKKERKEWELGGGREGGISKKDTK